MKTLFAILIGSTLALAATAQRQPPPPITSAPPPLNPNIAPATPQPGVAAGATGGSAFNAPSGIVTPRGGSNISTPFPVVVPQGAFPPYVESFDPFAVAGLYQMLEAPPTPEPVANGGRAQGRPGGLGVTITGGGANQPASGPGVTITGGSAQSVATSPPPAEQVPAVTNAPAVPNNPGGATVTNAPPQYP